MVDGKRIIVTGAAGFIGSCMVEYLNEKGYEDLILVDNFGEDEKRPNWSEKKFTEIVEKEFLFEWLTTHADVPVAAVIHMGANSSTTEFDYEVLKKWNVEYSQKLWDFCTANKIPYIYASSAATYGDGELGYDDNHEVIYQLKPLNPYGISKNEFDKWALEQSTTPTFWAGLKFFNVYGPNEQHKGRMASVISHAFHQIKENGKVKLFKSYKEGYEDGQQLRDFVYVKDLVKVMFWMLDNSLLENPIPSGLYNVGTGHARSFYDLVDSTFKAMEIETNIEFIEMPIDIRDKYQYFTEANMQKLHQAGYNVPFYELENGVKDYVQNYLATAIQY
jgi:ADP-L-glycero-D-manno-heptose 6-epimerase